ncbi:uncharacterized protein EV422DRAFT_180527 [Fimicolochytrium jonesii]|uniref:uncharacterized protein n=1 Tax=Fimicolochytrium jonesii TaxID=1396493 RepID=UPI0022FE7108|nr:uncharacterized protein EV422DRAFT_180527 [Fimicolochytrium jonesii]KAI8818331.1 hypothetical protein EV422DRAFT_180527 [Fimicolochytrium jonesii]
MVQKTYDVIVVGAGLAGLTAARRCLEAGLDVLVLEARDRVGGRTMTRQINGVVYDLGGMWINPDTQPLVGALVKEFDLNLFPQYRTGSSVLELEPGKLRTYTGDIPSISIPSLIDVQQGITRLESMCRKVPLDDPTKAKDAFAHDSITLAEWMRRNLWTRESKQMFDIACRSIIGVDPEEISFLWFLFYCHSGKGLLSLIEVEGAQKMRLEEGAATISKRLAALLPQSRIILSAAVQSIEQLSPDGSVTVFTNSTNIPYRARTVIFTAPPPQYTRVKWSPELPALKKHFTQRSTAMGYYTKVVLRYSTAFWRDNGLSGEMVSHCGPVSLVFDTCSGDAGVACLTAFLLSGAGREWSAQPPSQRKSVILHHLRTLTSSDLALHPIEYIEQDWSAEEYSGGCPVASMGCGLLTQYGTEIRAVHGNVHFAGTETATEWCGYMEGAVGSGERVAREVVGSLRGRRAGGEEGKSEVEAPAPRHVHRTRRHETVRTGWGWYALGVVGIVVGYVMARG